MQHGLFGQLPRPGVHRRPVVRLPDDDQVARTAVGDDGIHRVAIHQPDFAGRGATGVAQPAAKDVRDGLGPPALVQRGRGNERGDFCRPRERRRRIDRHTRGNDAEQVAVVLPCQPGREQGAGFAPLGVVEVDDDRRERRGLFRDDDVQASAVLSVESETGAHGDVSFGHVIRMPEC